MVVEVAPEGAAAPGADTAPPPPPTTARRAHTSPAALYSLFGGTTPVAPRSVAGEGAVEDTEAVAQMRASLIEAQAAGRRLRRSIQLPCIVMGTALLMTGSLLWFLSPVLGEVGVIVGTYGLASLIAAIMPGDVVTMRVWLALGGTNCLAIASLLAIRARPENNLPPELQWLFQARLGLWLYFVVLFVAVAIVRAPHSPPGRGFWGKLGGDGDGEGGWRAMRG